MDSAPSVLPQHSVPEYYADLACGTGSFARSKLRIPNAKVLCIDKKRDQADIDNTIRKYFTDDEWSRVVYVTMDLSDLTLQRLNAELTKA